MTDTVRVRNAQVYAYHGVKPEEATLGQRFYIDIDCTVDNGAAAQDDDYAQAICYGTLCDLAARIAGSERYELIETLADRLASAILGQFGRVQHVSVTVRKPSAPIPHPIDYVEVVCRKPRRAAVTLSLGSNMGDGRLNIARAVEELWRLPDFELLAVSSYYETAPWGKLDQPAFVNACASGTTSREPAALIRAFKQIEMAIGRRPGERWGPRLIDIDLLTYDDVEINRPDAMVPHPHMLERPFVLVPLFEIAPDLAVRGQRIADLAAAARLQPSDAPGGLR